MAQDGIVKAHIVQNLHVIGGIEVLVLAIKQLDIENTDIYSLDGSEEELTTKFAVDELLMKGILFLGKAAGFDWRCIVKLAKQLRQRQVEVIYTHHIGPLIYGGLAAKLAGIKKHIHIEHDAWHLQSKKNRLFQGIILKVCRPSVVADCQLVEKMLRRYFPSLPINMIFNGVDVEKFIPGDQFVARQKLDLPLDVPLIGCAGRLVEVKGQQVLVKALAQLPQDVHLVLAGEGEWRDRLVKLAVQLGVQQRLHFLGLINDTVSFYQAIDVFCMASLAEGLPLAPLEAQACGKICVLTNVGGSHESLCPTSGTLVEVNNVAELAIGIQDALAVEGAEPRNFVVNQRNFSTMVQSYQALAYIDNR